jgi:hypothetical protein
MKQGKNNEIDVMLRSLARGQRARFPLDPEHARALENQVSSEHLDADELSSFAEGVVPAPARARFIAHLADCDNCRGVVVGLTQASGAAIRSETLEQQPGGGFWRNLASLFSAPVLRYAVPALALTAVIAISFLALRQQQRRAFVAQNEGTAAPALTSEQRAESPLAQPNRDVTAKTQNTPELRLRPDSTTDRKAFQDDRSSVAQAPLRITGADAPSSSVSKSADQSKGTFGGLAKPVFAPEPKAEPAPPPPPKSALSDADKAVATQNEVSKREVQGLPVEEQNQPRDELGRHGPSRNNNAVNSARRSDGFKADGVMAERGESRAKSKKDSEDEAETRTVSGKRFRRQGNTWVDTAYESSRRTINVSRGSEQFRALVADEPSIRTIAEKLSGVVIVVSNGRAYRIN